jgi:hypothetical protein
VKLVESDGKGDKEFGTGSTGSRLLSGHTALLCAIALVAPARSLVINLVLKSCFSLSEQIWEVSGNAFYWFEGNYDMLKFQNLL